MSHLTAGDRQQRCVRASRKRHQPFQVLVRLVLCVATHAVAYLEDDDPPAQRPGGYLERTAPSSGPFRSRLLRGPDAPDQQLRTAPATDDTQVWTVSHEDAPGYQRLWRQDGDSSNPR